MTRHKDLISSRLAKETGTLYGHGRQSVALVYPSPYAVGMASLGFQTIYGRLNHWPDTYAERAFLPDIPDHGPLLTYESQRPAADFDVVAFSVAYELELSGVLQCLRTMGLQPLRHQRDDTDPLVVMGGPLTFSNPVPLAPFADVIVMGEAEELIGPLVDAACGRSRAPLLNSLRDVEGLYVPEHHGTWMPPVAKASDDELPACSVITTPESALSDMFLIENERGCSRACSFCVMRRSTNGGMRKFPVDKILSRIADHARRVGLVGAAVSDHPRLVELVAAIVDSGREVSLSSLRSDRLTPELVELLHRGGTRTLTVASDGASERQRRLLHKKIRERHLLRAAELARDARFQKLKIYIMVGVPDETDADLDELIDFTRQQADICGAITKVALGIAPFVAKRNTPLDGTPFVGVAEADRRIRKLRRALTPRVDIRPTSTRWAWVEYQLAQGGIEAGLAAHRAWQAGGRFADYKRAFKELEPMGAPAQARSVLPLLSGAPSQRGTAWS